MNKMAAPSGQHGKYLFWLQLLNSLADFHTVFSDDLRKRCSLFPDQGDWCHSSPLTHSEMCDSDRYTKRLYNVYHDAVCSTMSCTYDHMLSIWDEIISILQ